MGLNDTISRYASACIVHVHVHASYVSPLRVNSFSYLSFICKHWKQWILIFGIPMLHHQLGIIYQQNIANHSWQNDVAKRKIHLTDLYKDILIKSGQLC